MSISFSVLFFFDQNQFITLRRYPNILFFPSRHDRLVSWSTGRTAVGILAIGLFCLYQWISNFKETKDEANDTENSRNQQIEHESDLKEDDNDNDLSSLWLHNFLVILGISSSIGLSFLFEFSRSSYFKQLSILIIPSSRILLSLFGKMLRSYIGSDFKAHSLSLSLHVMIGIMIIGELILKYSLLFIICGFIQQSRIFSLI